MNAVSIFAIAGAILGPILASALVMSRGGNRPANQLLALFMVVSTIYLICLFFIHNSWHSHQLILVTSLDVIFLNGPLLYGYVRAMTRQLPLPLWAIGLHLLPFSLLVARSIWIGVDTPDINESFRQARGGWPPTLFSLVGIAYYGLLVFYSLASLRILRRHQQTVMHQYSRGEGVNLRWLRLLCTVCLVIACVGLMIALFRIFGDITLWPRGIYSMLLLLVVFYLIAFMGIAQPGVFIDTALSISAATDSPDAEGEGAQLKQKPEAQYQTSTLTPTQAADCWQRVQTYMVVHKPYVDNKLKLLELAQMLDMPASHLSQVINQIGGGNFFQVINGYRVAEAQELLSGGTLSTSDIALEAGFNSESTFYKQFRKTTGMTPRQFRLAHENGPNIEN